MGDRIDEFFKSRLTNHLMAPTPNAWSKVKANLSKKNKGIIWFRAAAALLFLGLMLGAIGWFQSKRMGTTPSTITNVDVSKQNNSSIQNSKGREELNHDPKKKSHPTTPRKPYLTRIDKGTKIKNQVIEKIQQPIYREATNIIGVSESIVVSQPKYKKPIVLEFRLEEIPTPMPLTELNEREVAEVDSKNGIQKALGFALEVKNGESSILNLHQAKENLFALNFKKDKKTITQ